MKGKKRNEQTDKHKQTNIYYKHTNKITTNTYTYKQKKGRTLTNQPTDRHTYIHTDRQTDRQTDGQMQRVTGR